MTTPSTRAGGPVLEIRDLAVSYGGVVQALRGVSLTVHEGTVVALLGSNGAGKTTLLRTLSGTLRPAPGARGSGRGRSTGAPTSWARDAAACVASGLVQVPEGRRIFTRLTVEENLRAGGLSVRDRGERAADYQRIYDLFPVLSDRRTQRGRTALRRGAADARHRARPDGQARVCCSSTSRPWDSRRASSDRSGRSSARSTARAPRCCWSSRTRPWPSASPDRRSSSTSGRCRCRARPTSSAKSDAVQRLYLGHSADGAAHATRRGCRPPGSSRGGRSEYHDGQPDLRADVETLTVDRVTVAVRRREGALGRVVHGASPAPCTRSSVPTAPASRRCSTCSRASTGRRRARYVCGDTVLSGMRPHKIARLGVARAFQNIALSDSQTVGENLMLGRHALTRAGFIGAGLRLPSATREAPPPRRAGPRDRGLPRTSAPSSTPRSGCCRTATRSGWRWRAHCAPSRDCCCSTNRWPGMNAEETERMAVPCWRSATRSASPSSWSSTTWAWS